MNRRATPCEACGSKGWLLTNQGNDENIRMAIERCDTCETFASDNDAVVHVAQLAEQANHEIKTD